MFKRLDHVSYEWVTASYFIFAVGWVSSTLWIDLDCHSNEGNVHGQIIKVGTRLKTANTENPWVSSDFSEDDNRYSYKELWWELCRQICGCVDLLLVDSSLTLYILHPMEPFLGLYSESGKAGLLISYNMVGRLITSGILFVVKSLFGWWQVSWTGYGYECKMYL